MEEFFKMVRGATYTYMVDKISDSNNSLKDLKDVHNIIKMSNVGGYVKINDNCEIYENVRTEDIFIPPNNIVSLIHYVDAYDELFGAFIYFNGYMINNECRKMDVDFKSKYYYKSVIVQTYKLKNEYINLK